MNRRTISFGLVLSALVASAVPPLAHHGTLVAYDRTKAWTRDATVTGFNFELLPNPAALIRNGWTRARSEQALKPGTSIKITIAPPRAGGMVGLLVKMTDMNGTELLKDDGLPPPPDNSLSAQPQPAKP